MATALNYFNYFTEIEEHFWRKRGAHILVSPLDWAIVETWQRAGIPLEAVLRGIDRAFESYARSRRGASGRTMKSLAYCTDAVLDAAEELKEAAAGKGPQAGGPARAATGFGREELARYFAAGADKLARAAEGLAPAAPGGAPGAEHLVMAISSARTSLEALAPLLDAPGALDLEELERRLTVIEDRLSAALLAAAPEDVVLDIRREMDRALAPYRRKMSAAQLAELERRYIHKRLCERYAVPRLSLFYMT